MPDRLSALDASFLAAETPTAHMHVGWASVFDPPARGERPSFEALREHVARRLPRSERYRQRLATVPFGIHDPVWVDDHRFELDRHLFDASGMDLHEVVDAAMSRQLDRSRPLWELWIAPHLADGRIGVVGKAHHCMVDGLAAVELAALLFDPTERSQPIKPSERWRPRPAPGNASILLDAIFDRAREQLGVLQLPARLAASPERLAGIPGDLARAATALRHAFVTPAPTTALNEPISSLRHLAMVARPLDQLRTISRAYGTTINDVVLAVCAGASRRFMRGRGERPVALKTMVPVSVRAEHGASELGNRIVFVFVALPCTEPDPVRRLRQVARAMRERKQGGEPRGAEAVFGAVSHVPHTVQRALTRLITSPRTFNLVVSNIPGPASPLYMHGCRLVEAYPVVPLVDHHALSIGVTSVCGRACFGLYADRSSLPDADRLALDIEAEIDDLLARAGDREASGREREPVGTRS